MADELPEQDDSSRARLDFIKAFASSAQSGARQPRLARRLLAAGAAVLLVGGVAVAIGALIPTANSSNAAHTSSASGLDASSATRRATPTARPTAKPTRKPSPRATHAAAPIVQYTYTPSPAPVTTAPKPVRAAPANGPEKISGQVSCTSGHNVAGVWVEASAGKGFAPFSSQGNGSSALFSYTLPRHESWSLHVGCGGALMNWQVALTTASVTGSAHSFTCIDIPGQANYGFCPEN